MKSKRSLGRITVHAMLIIYGLILAYVLAGLVVPFEVSADVFFDLSFALLIFAFFQALYELCVSRALLFVLISSAIGFGAEVLGTSTGFPFGKYHYSDFLGPKVLGVPVVVPFVWFVISYLTLSIAFKSFGERRKDWNAGIKLAALAAFGAMAWDLLIDPMFSSYGYWVWDAQGSSGPELSGIPLSNFVGWFVIVFVMVLVYLAAVYRGRPLFQRINTKDSMIVYVFLLIDGTIANLSLGHNLVVLIGALAMLIFLGISYLNEGPPVKKKDITQPAA